jgi:glycosyltransferase involved in cell wall biosynthesis
LDPHPFFQSSYYRAQAKIPHDADVNELVHFRQYGAASGISPFPLFDYGYYALHCPDVVRSGIELFQHFVEYGFDEGRPSHVLFDANFYLRHSPDVVAAGLPALKHYIQNGAAELRAPNPYFIPRFYVRKRNMAASAKANPLVDFLVYGAQQNCSPNPLFSYETYTSSYHDVVASGIEPFCHFIGHGDRERRSPHILFDPAYYAYANDHLSRSGLPPFRHFMEHGEETANSPSPMFDIAHYQKLYPAELRASLNPLIDYLTQPPEARRHPHPLFDGLYQTLTDPTNAGTETSALETYLKSRSRLDEGLVKRRQTSIPMPLRAHMPRRHVSTSNATDETLISIVLPCYNSDRKWLRRAIDSVRAQTHELWELILVNDGSPDPSFKAFLGSIARLDPRIRVIELEQNMGIARATNKGLEACSGEFVAFLDHDDELVPCALEKCISKLRQEGADACFSDQAYVTQWNTIERTFHKPAWSPVMFSGVMYIGHLLIVRRDIVIEIGGFDPKYDRVQDFELMLRLGERTQAIAHVPEILYYWRQIPGSIAADANAKGRIEPVQAAAVNAHFKRIGFSARARPIEHLHHRLSLVPLNRESYPDIDVIVDSRGWNSRRDETLHHLKSIPGIQEAQPWILEDASHLRALGGRSVDTIAEGLCAGRNRFLLYVNSQFRLPSDNWIDRLLMYIELGDVAMVGTNIFSPEETCLAAGLIVDPVDGLVPAMRGYQSGDDGYAGSLACDREVTAVAPGLILIDRLLLKEINKAEGDYTSAFFALGELSMRCCDEGFRNITLASVRSLAYDAHDLQESGIELDRTVFLDVYAERVKMGDRYYNPNFKSGCGDYSA